MVPETAKAGFTASDHAVVVVKQNNRITGIRESPRSGRAVAADRGDDGSIDYSLVGGSPQGEEDTLFVAKTLVKALNRQGASWKMPVSGEGDVDAIAQDRSNPERRLQMQVVQAVVDGGFLRERSRAGGASGSAHDAVLVEQLRMAIEHKSRMPEARRGQLVLALNAVATGHHALVVDAFRERYGSWAREQGFQSIWLVGPTMGLTARLD